MKHTTYTTIGIACFLIGVGSLVAPMGCSCTGDTSGLEPQLTDAEQPDPEETATAAPDRQSPAAIVPVVIEEEDEVALPFEDEGEPEEEPAVEEPEEEAEEATEDPEGSTEEAEEAEEEPEEPGRDYPLEAVAYQFITNVVAEPAPRAQVIGYLRRGARVRVTERVEGRGCSRGWHEVEGGGYLCDGGGVTVAEHPADWPDAAPQPRLEDPLPYDYYGAVRDYVPEYREIPSQEQIAQAQRFARSIRLEREGVEEDEEANEEASSAEGEATADSAESSGASEGSTEAASAAEAVEESELEIPSHVRMLHYRGFIVSSMERQGRWQKTVRGRYVERAKYTEREAPTFHGVELGEEMMLPIGFVTHGRAKALRPRPGNQLRFDVAGTLRRLSAVPILGEVYRGERRYLSIGRRLLARSNILAVAEPTERPPHIGPNERWIDIDLSEQMLVAYEGDRPVYVTLVSTGRSADGFGTPTGSFRIRTKHVSATMDDPDGGDEAYSIEDVPWTMYFHESYALHAAFWHNNFGRERSHGCVNLAPADARWLFFWAGPELPPGWHGIRSSRERLGTAIIIRD